MTFLQLGFFRLTSGFDGFSKMSADVCPDRLHYPTAIAYRPMERTGLRARKTSSPCDQADEGRKVKIIPRRQACPQVTSPLSSEWLLLAQSYTLKYFVRTGISKDVHFCSHWLPRRRNRSANVSEMKQFSNCGRL